MNFKGSNAEHIDFLRKEKKSYPHLESFSKGRIRIQFFYSPINIFFFEKSNPDPGNLNLDPQPCFYSSCIIPGSYIW